MRIRIWRVLPFLGLAVIGCRPSGDGAGNGDADDSAASAVPSIANVRVVNAMPDVAGLDVLADGHTEFAAIEFRGASMYHALPRGTQVLAATRSGEPDTAALARDTGVELDGAWFTVVALGSAADGSARLVLLRDDTPPDPARARVRLLSAAGGSPTGYDLFMSGRDVALAQGVVPGESARTIDLDPGTVTFEVRRPGQRSAVLKIPELRLEAGTGVTIVLTGAAGKGSRIDAVTIPDSPAPGTSGVMSVPK